MGARIIKKNGGTINVEVDLDQQLARLAAASHALPRLRGERNHAMAEDLRSNIENFLGMAAGRLAEITAAVCLAGELSILSALAEGHFTAAHEALGRK